MAAKRSVKLTRDALARAVARLFTNGVGERGSRLILVCEDAGCARVHGGAKDLGGYSEAGLLQTLERLLLGEE